MRGRRGRLGAAMAVLAAAALLVSACGGATATPTTTEAPSAVPSPTAMPTIEPSSSVNATESETAAPSATETLTPVSPTATPSPTPAGAFYLQYWSVAPLGPENTFGNAPVVISGGKLMSVVSRQVLDSDPLLVPATARTITAAGLATIVAEAQSDGLLGTKTSFECPHAADAPMMAGTATEHLVLTVSGATHSLTASCPYQEPPLGSGKPAAGTWAAFRHFKNLLADPAGWLKTAAGTAVAYDPDRLAVLVEASGSGEVPLVADWPLAKFATFGVELGGGRCAVVSGWDAATLLPVVRAATDATVFRDADGTVADIIVRAFMPGEPDPCKNG